MGLIDVYTDGSCLDNGRGNPRAGIGVHFPHNTSLDVSRPATAGRPTNNNAEIEAARVAIEVARSAGYFDICINTDSQFLVDCLTKWMPTWKRNKWRTVKGDPVENRIELEKLDSCIGAYKNFVYFVKIPAHSKVPGNEVADRLAKAGAERYKNGST